MADMPIDDSPRAIRTKQIVAHLQSTLDALTDDEFAKLSLPGHDSWLPLLLDQSVHRVAGKDQKRAAQIRA